MLSNTSRWLTYLNAILYAILGIFLFFLSERLAPVFAWKVAPFMIATIVIGLAIYGLYAQIGDVGRNGGVFPEIMSLFTLRAFAAFYFSLSVSAAVGLRERNLSTLLNFGFSSYLHAVAITAAIFVYFHLFDFANHPGQLIYVGAYFLVGIPLAITLLREGTGLRQA